MEGVLKALRTINKLLDDELPFVQQLPVLYAFMVGMRLS